MIAGLVLAAGGGKRFGGPKALFRPADGRLLVERAVQAVRDGGCDPVYVVLGAEADRVRREAELGAVSLVDNPAWGSGMGSSLRAGLTALGGTAAEAALVLLVDTPGIGAAAVARVCAAGRGPDALLTATYAGRRGHPVLLGRDHWAGVVRLAQADVGARPYLAAHAEQVRGVPCEDIADDADLDYRPAT